MKTDAKRIYDAMTKLEGISRSRTLSERKCEILGEAYQLLGEYAMQFPVDGKESEQAK